LSQTRFGLLALKGGYGLPKKRIVPTKRRGDPVWSIQFMHCLGRTLLWVIFLLPATSVAPVLADECEIKAAEIVGKIGLNAGARTKANFIPLSAPTDEDDDYGAYLNCVGPHGMSLRYVSPANPSQKWFEFVGRTGAILTGIKAAWILRKRKVSIPPLT
jgi:hypothetical protein